MNANEITPKNQLPLNRIQRVSKCIRLFLQYGIPLIFLASLIFFYLVFNHKISLPKPSHPSEVSSVANAHREAFRLWGILNLAVLLFWYRTALKLFGFFEKGILFTVETVRCIQMLGGIYLVSYLVELGFYFFVPLSRTQQMGTGVSDLFTGFLIICIGWLIDEARKIHEEQELTV
jgi:hypothetical protein